MSNLLTTLSKKSEVDSIIKDTIDRVLVLRFGRASDPTSLQLDQIVCFPFLINFKTLEFLLFYFTQFQTQTLYFILCDVVLLIQLSKAAREVSKFANVALVDVDSQDIQVYVKYFDITLIPSTVFFFNAHHMKMDSGYASIYCLLFWLYLQIYLFSLFIVFV